MPQEQEQKKETLSDFINDNDKLLTTMGVFGGLTALFTTIENGEVLSFLSFFIFLVLGWELYTRFPNWREWRESTIKLFIFRILSLVLVFGVAVYLLYSYLSYFALSLVYIFFICLFVFEGIIIPKIKNFFQQHETLGDVVAYVLAGLIGLCILVAFFVILGLILNLLGFIQI